MAKAMNVSCGVREQIDALFIALHVPSQSQNDGFMFVNFNCSFCSVVVSYTVYLS
jgi:hypothetical protein